MPPNGVTPPHQGSPTDARVPGMPISNQPTAGLASGESTFLFLLHDGSWFRTTPLDLFEVSSLIKALGLPSSALSPRKGYH